MSRVTTEEWRNEDLQKVWQEKCAMHLQERQVLCRELHTRLQMQSELQASASCCPAICNDRHCMCWDVPPQYPLMLYAHREIVQCIFSSEQILPLTCFFPDVLLVLGRHAQFLGAKLDPMVQDQFVCSTIPLYENTWKNGNDKYLHYCKKIKW